MYRKGQSLIWKVKWIFRVGTCVPKTPVRARTVSGKKKNAFFPYYSIHNTDILILLCLPTSKRKQKKKKTVAFYTYNKYRKYSGVFFRQAWFLKSTFSFWKMWLQPSDHVSGRTWPLSTKAPCKSPRRKRNVTWTSGNVIRLQTE